MSTTDWKSLLFTRRMLICVFTGFASGLPLYILINLVPAWLKSEGVNLKAIGFFALIQFPFTWIAMRCQALGAGAAGCS